MRTVKRPLGRPFRLTVALPTFTLSLRRRLLFLVTTALRMREPLGRQTCTLNERRLTHFFSEEGVTLCTGRCSSEGQPGLAQRTRLIDTTPLLSLTSLSSRRNAAGLPVPRTT